MRTKKNGEPSIPKAELNIRAKMHRQFADELLGMAKAAGTFGETLLKTAIDRHIRLSVGFDGLCEDVAKGRPKTNKLAAILPKPPAKKPGRPRKVTGVDMDVATYIVVEQRRKELALSNKTKPTVKAAIDSINAQYARGTVQRESKVVKGDYETVKSAYNRGKKKEKEKGQN